MDENKVQFSGAETTEDLSRLVRQLKTRIQELQEERATVGESLIRANKIAEVIQAKAEENAIQIVKDAEAERESILNGIEKTKELLTSDIRALEEMKTKIIKELKVVVEKYRNIIKEEEKLLANAPEEISIYDEVTEEKEVPVPPAVVEAPIVESPVVKEPTVAEDALNIEEEFENEIELSEIPTVESGSGIDLTSLLTSDTEEASISTVSEITAPAPVQIPEPTTPQTSLESLLSQVSATQNSTEKTPAVEHQEFSLDNMLKTNHLEASNAHSEVDFETPAVTNEMLVPEPAHTKDFSDIVPSSHNQEASMDEFINALKSNTSTPQNSLAELLTQTSNTSNFEGTEANTQVSQPQTAQPVNINDLLSQLNVENKENSSNQNSGNLTDIADLLN